MDILRGSTVGMQYPGAVQHAEDYVGEFKKKIEIAVAKCAQDMHREVVAKSNPAAAALIMGIGGGPNQWLYMALTDVVAQNFRK